MSTAQILSQQPLKHELIVILLKLKGHGTGMIHSNTALFGQPLLWAVSQSVSRDTGTHKICIMLITGWPEVMGFEVGELLGLWHSQ